MKKVVNINLAGQAFTIDEDAYHALDKYLKSIERHFRKSEGAEDILYDIEARIAELFLENDRHSKIVTMDKLNAVISVLGKPEEFGAEEQTQSKSEGEPTNEYKTGKRLYRNPNNKVIGGVASGLSAYFGIDDPIWIRIAFVFMFLTMGIGVIPYVVLWIIVPEAKTSSDFLSMRGEPINVDSIAKTVEDGLYDLKEKFDEFSKEIKKKSNSHTFF